MLTNTLVSTLALSSLATAYSVTTSSKRGLIFIPNATYPEDNKIWYEQGSDLSWYYNYGASPSVALASTDLAFIPMLWGAPASLSDTTFLTTIEALISSGTNVSHVLTFNEPDGTSETGGSNVDPATAAELWKTNVEPLKAKGVKLGAPAVTGSPAGFTWLQSFFTACAGNCSADFIPVHWYGDFSGLASHMGQVNGTYPNMTMWITEYAYDNAALNATQDFFQESLDYFDRLSYVTHYSYFGSFRSSSSNIGPNPAMLGADGQLTDIGLWYLGMNGTGVAPTSAAPRLRMSLGSVAAVVVAAAAGWLL